VSISRCVALLLASVFVGAGATSETLSDGVYALDQINTGEALYKKHCISCHDKKYFGPVLKNWSGQPLNNLFLTMATTMPESNPGMLYDEEYADILAYVLSLNRFPAGDSELTADPATLKLIEISH
jgi:mono/diheme cytochrome c family protein